MRHPKCDDSRQVMQPVAVVAHVQCTPKRMPIIMTLMAWGLLRLNNLSWYVSTQIGLSKQSVLVLEGAYKQGEHKRTKGKAYLVLDLSENEREVGGQVANGYPTQSLRGNCLDIFR